MRVTAYRIKMKRNDGKWRIVRPNTAAPTYLLTGLRPGRYSFMVAARNEMGWGPAVSTDRRVRIG